MPQGGADKNLDPRGSGKNRSSSNSEKRKNYTPNKLNKIKEKGKKYLTYGAIAMGAAGDAPSAISAGSPATNQSTSAKKMPPKPTGSASPSKVKRRSPQNQSRSVGPEAIARPVNPVQMASRLHSDRLKSANDNNAGQTREEMIADSGDTGESVLPGQYDPLQENSAYGNSTPTAPGSMSEAKADDENKGGGQMQSDLERQRAMQLQQGKMASVQQNAGGSVGESGLPSLSGAQAKESQSKEESQQQTPVKEESSKLFRMGQDAKGGGELDKAQQIAQAVGAERVAKAAQTAKNVKGNLEALRKAQKTLQSFWNLIKAGELAAGVSVVSIIVLVVTANLQMINKYTFKNKLIPETFFVEDGAIVCTDCALCGASCISVFAMPMVLIPFIAAVIVMGGVLGLDHFGIIDMAGFMSDAF
ncbi:MAG: hypothetical protein P1P90_06185 [Patescibacteria group bacterium]|nr:hypothetical protein [Patescibacteria group bacterium]